MHGVPKVVEGGSSAESRVPIYFLYTCCILPVPNLPMCFSAGRSLHTMQKAIAAFVGIVHRVTPYWEPGADARHQTRKLLQLVVCRVLRDAEIVVRSDNNSLMIDLSKMRQLDDDRMSEEVLQILLFAGNMRLSTRNMLKLKQLYQKGVARGERKTFATRLPPCRCCPGLCGSEPPPYVHFLK